MRPKAKALGYLESENLFVNYLLLHTYYLLPAASERAIQLHDRECFIFLGDGQIELRRVVVGVVGKHFKVAG